MHPIREGNNEFETQWNLTNMLYRLQGIICKCWKVKNMELTNSLNYQEEHILLLEVLFRTLSAFIQTCYEKISMYKIHSNSLVKKSIKNDKTHLHYDTSHIRLTKIWFCKHCPHFPKSNWKQSCPTTDAWQTSVVTLSFGNITKWKQKYSLKLNEKQMTEWNITVWLIWM